MFFFRLNGFGLGGIALSIQTTFSISKGGINKKNYSPKYDIVGSSDRMVCQTFSAYAATSNFFLQQVFALGKSNFLLF